MQTKGRGFPDLDGTDQVRQKNDCILSVNRLTKEKGIWLARLGKDERVEKMFTVAQ